MPETLEGVVFDELGICRACQSSEQKIHINWVDREKNLRKILDEAKAKAGNNYDCIVPISGGKDSAFQLHVLTKIYGMKPLCVTFSHNWWSESGWYNLQNSLEKFNVDHIAFTPNRALINRLAKRSIEGIGDTNWHDHAGVGAFPLQVAVKWKIPLLIWGEGDAESSGRSSYTEQLNTFDR
ncbi:N-acetyl sugar amidotransferase, partial [Candidatus Kaiserbacteria bacterium]|nr:N-acetyl sugar amidotransferase [Candidatus Kaiserbacteria bacterium]